MRRLLPWLLLLPATVAAGAGLDALTVPSAYLFAALIAGLLVALIRPGLVAVPERAFLAAQALTGVVIGAYLQSDALASAADDWLPVTVVSVLTLLLCVLAGKVLARTTGLDEPTAALGSVAGGASGIVVMAEELGADDRLVAFMQYLRVLVVVLLTPVIAALAFPGAGTGSPPAEAVVGHWDDWVITLACAPVGVLAGRVLRLPAGALLGPMAVAAVVTLTGVLGDWEVPGLLREASFIGIGLQVGLRFTLATVRQVGRLLVPVLLSIVALLVGCFGLALLMAPWADVTLLDAYLATTPGGLYAVLAIAFGAQANTTFILAVQAVRLIVMVALAPAVVRWTVRPRPPRGKPATLER